MGERWEVRMARPDDHDAIIEVVDERWGRPVAAAVPRLFLDHFYKSSLVAETSGVLAGLLIGFVSPSLPDEAYIHFAGVRPDLRGAGLGRELYGRFIARAAEQDRTVIRATTSPSNHESIEFHRRLGFEVLGPVPDYNRPGTEHVLFKLDALDRATR
jgi:ribosomal protein S18 acetylase RimI-like enzyme